MSNNPFQSPQQSKAGDSAPASGKATPCGIALIVAGVLSLLASGYWAFSGGVAMTLGDQVMQQMDEQSRQQMEEARAQGVDPQAIMKGVGIGYVIFGLLGVVCSAVVIYGGICMLKLSSRKMAMTAAIISCIPFLQSCCLISLPIGIWAIVTLNSPEVKAAMK